MNVICVDLPSSPKVMKEFKKRFKYKYDTTLDVLLGALSQSDGKTQETPIPRSFNP